MAKQKPEPHDQGAKPKDDRSNRRSSPIQIEKDLARMAAVIASHRGITLADLCSPVLRPYLTLQYRLVQQEMLKELGEAGGQ